MEAKELMIGDWVHIKDVNWNLKVVSLSTSTFADWNGDGEYNIITANYDLPNYGDYIESKEDEVEPIPLTPEILEKNGLDKVPELSMVLNRDTMPMYHSPMLHYVHELQHALRLCGLDQLADDFKV